MTLRMTDDQLDTWLRGLLDDKIGSYHQAVENGEEETADVLRGWVQSLTDVIGTIFEGDLGLFTELTGARMGDTDLDALAEELDDDDPRRRKPLAGKATRRGSGSACLCARRRQQTRRRSSRPSRRPTLPMSINAPGVIGSSV